MKRLLIVATLAGCADNTSNDVVGPFTGETHRFVVDSITLPRTSDAGRAIADDLDGDGNLDNQLGLLLATLNSQDLVTEHGAQMIASGAIASIVEIVADDLMSDDAVGVTYFGGEGESAIVAGGRIENGVFRSNRTRESAVPGAAVMYLPVFVDADPVVIELVGMQLDLAPDGAGGYDAVIHGAFPEDEAKAAAFEGLLELTLANPGGHRVLRKLVDVNNDGVVTLEEFESVALFQSLLARDLELRGMHVLSAGFRVHLKPCPDGRCTSAPTAPCFDRVLDGDETSVDCGGSCRKCPAEATCSLGSDCQTGACDAGHCRAPTCSDGIEDGFESDVDCGANCPRCQLGQACVGDLDCVTGNCTSEFSEGVCVAGGA